MCYTSEPYVIFFVTILGCGPRFKPGTGDVEEGLEGTLTPRHHTF